MNIINNLRNKLNILIPDSKCTIYGDDYDSIDWFDVRSFPSAVDVAAVNYDPVEIQRVVDIKSEAGKRIKSNVPTAKPNDSKEKLLEREINLMMLNAELDDIKINGGSLDATQQAQKDAFIALKNVIKDIRTMAESAITNSDSLVKFISDLDAKGY